MSNASVEVQVPIQWIYNPNAEAHLANQTLVQNGPPTLGGQVDTFYLVFGHVNPPMFMTDGTSPISQESVGGVVVPVNEVARVVLSKDRLKELAASINGVLASVE